jgi:hypothetical protein
LVINGGISGKIVFQQPAKDFEDEDEDEKEEDIQGGNDRVKLHPAERQNTNRKSLCRLASEMHC